MPFCVYTNCWFWIHSSLTLTYIYIYLKFKFVLMCICSNFENFSVFTVLCMYIYTFIYIYNIARFERDALLRLLDAITTGSKIQTAMKQSPRTTWKQINNSLIRFSLLELNIYTYIWQLPPMTYLFSEIYKKHVWFHWNIALRGRSR